jgi:6-phosphogluconate dehydrogenase
MKIGILGLGKMGSRIAEKLMREGHQVVVWNRSENAVLHFKLQVKDFVLPGDVETALTIQELIAKLPSPRVLWLMLPAGEATETVLQEAVSNLGEEDIIIDGGNAMYKDTERRYQSLKEKNIRFLGIGVSGGVKAFDNGYPLMAGGDKRAYEYIAPVLDSLAKPNGGHVYLGEGGSGHFVKMVHNGIEYGMMQAIGEGFGILDKAPYPLDLQKVAELWQKGTIVSGFLMECAKDAIITDPQLKSIDGVIDATGEAEWTVTQGREEGVPVENIEQSLHFRNRSKTDKEISGSYAARMVAALRREFGGHAVKSKP